VDKAIQLHRQRNAPTTTTAASAVVVPPPRFRED
jgi:hypothetical protein